MAVGRSASDHRANSTRSQEPVRGYRPTSCSRCPALADFVRLADSELAATRCNWRGLARCSAPHAPVPNRHGARSSSAAERREGGTALVTATARRGFVVASDAVPAAGLTANPRFAESTDGPGPCRACAISCRLPGINVGPEGRAEGSPTLAPSSGLLPCTVRAAGRRRSRAMRSRRLTARRAPEPAVEPVPLHVPHGVRRSDRGAAPGLALAVRSMNRRGRSWDTALYRMRRFTLSPRDRLTGTPAQGPGQASRHQ